LATPNEEDQKWLTAFVCDAGVFEFNRAPFGLKGSGSSFVRAISEILQPVKGFCESFVDDVAVHSNKWRDHMRDLEKFLTKIKSSGLTLNLKTCKWAQSQVKFCGRIIGSGKQFADPGKLRVLQDMQPPNKVRVEKDFGIFQLLSRSHPKFYRSG